MKTNIITSALFAALLTTSTAFAHTEPTDDKKTAKAASVEVVTFKTSDNKIRVNIQKTGSVLASLELRNSNGMVVYNERLGRKQASSATKLDVSNLEDGIYELKVSSSVGSYTKKITIATPTAPTQRFVSVY